MNPRWIRHSENLKGSQGFFRKQEVIWRSWCPDDLWFIDIYMINVHYIYIYICLSFMYRFQVWGLLGSLWNVKVSNSLIFGHLNESISLNQKIQARNHLKWLELWCSKATAGHPCQCTHPSLPGENDPKSCWCGVLIKDMSWRVKCQIDR